MRTSTPKMRKSRSKAVGSGSRKNTTAPSKDSTRCKVWIGGPPRNCPSACHDGQCQFSGRRRLRFRALRPPSSSPGRMMRQPESLMRVFSLTAVEALILSAVILQSLSADEALLPDGKRLEGTLELDQGRL